jgi:hypothetical protein
MNTEFICLTIVLTLVVTAYSTVRFCADAVLHGGRNWWRKAAFLAEQRIAYRSFCADLDELERVELECIGKMAERE